MRRLWAALPALTFSIILAACGGGGGDSAPVGGGGGGGGGGGATGPTTVAATQDGAAALATKATSSATIEDIKTAANAGQIPLGVTMLRLPVGATQSQTIQCSQLSSNGTGSGSLSVTVTTNDATGQPVSANFSYNACSFTSGDVSFNANGTGTLQYAYFNNAEDFQFTITYNITYAVTSPQGNQSGTINASETCTVTNGAGETCVVNVNGSQISGSTVTTSGTTVSIGSATYKYGNITIVYSNVVWDGSLGRMTSGTITITDSATGNQAVITATANGYQVVITANGSTTTWTVAYSG